MNDVINKLNKRIASLETQVDYLEAEYSYLNEALMQYGFPEGIKTLKASVEECLAEIEIPLYGE